MGRVPLKWVVSGLVVMMSLVLVAANHLHEAHGAGEEMLSGQQLLAFGEGMLLALVAVFFLRFYRGRRSEQRSRSLHNGNHEADKIPALSGRNEIAQLGQRFAEMTRETAAQDRRLRAFFERSFQYVVLLSPDGTIIDLNELAQTFVGGPKEQIVGRKAWDGPWMGGSHEAQDNMVADITAAAEGQHVVRQLTFVNGEGEPHHMSYSVRPIQDVGGGLEWLLLEAHDVTDLRLEESRRRKLTAFYATLRDLNSAIVRDKSREQLFRDVCNIIVTHGEFFGAYIGLVDKVSKAVVPVAGAGVESPYITGIRLSVDPALPEGQGPSGQAIRQQRPYICNDFANDPSTVPWRERALGAGIRSAAVFPLREAGMTIGALILYAHEVDAFDEELTALLEALAQDISFALDGILRQKQIESLSYYDTLTGLPNRSLLRDRVDQLLRNAPRFRQQTALVYLDLDHFKHINDSLGHAVGDEILKLVAARLSALVSGSDSLSRFGGDDFVLVFSDTDPDQVGLATQNLLAAFDVPFSANGQSLSLRASAGIAIYPQDGRTFDELYQHADAAMYRAKELGRNRYHFYTNELNDWVTERLLLENALRGAIDNNELSLHYQPQIDIRTDTVIGIEALMRWTSPEFGQVSPAKFIPIAEESDLIVRLGEWAVDEACRQLRALQDEGLAALPVSVNVSSRQFSEQIFNMIDAALKRHRIDPCHLELEITESLLAGNLETTLDTLDRLSELGIGIAVDDFGTGYSNLAYLKRFPLDKLKIDQSFVHDLVSNDEDRAIATAVVNLGHSLELSVIAEGVETAAQLEVLRSIGCDAVQGYLFSKPLPAEQLVDYLRKRRELENGI